MGYIRPPWCLNQFDRTDMPCECLSQKRDIFCIGKTNERVDIIDGQKHHNDYNFCVRSDAKGITRFRFNIDDISLVTQMLLTARSEACELFNLHWFFDKAFTIDDDNQLRVLPAPK